MKSKLLLLSFLMLFTFTTNYAQSSASVSGIAVQGIARNDNNTALINASVRFTFTIYNRATTDVVHTEDPTITTDEFGVFSHTIAIPTEKYANFGGKVLWLKIEDDKGVISDEIFKQVPYAINASNGVPTGSIMPFVGIEAPDGWVLCDGKPLDQTVGAEASADLQVLIGSNAPDLRGMFLRGAGTNTVTDYTNNVGPNLNERQGDAIKAHRHAATNGSNDGDLTAALDGEHQHDIIKLPIDQAGPEGTGDVPTLNNTSGKNEKWLGVNDVAGFEDTGLDAVSKDGKHTHPITGSTANYGIHETRPVNYGVNYIIKL